MRSEGIDYFPRRNNLGVESWVPMRCNIHYFPAGLIEFFNERTEVLLQLLTPYRRYYEWHLNYFVEVISSHVSRRAAVMSLNRFLDNKSVYSDDKHTRSFVQK